MQSIKGKTGKLLLRVILTAVIAAGVIFGAISLIDYVGGVREAGRLKSLSEIDRPHETAPAPASEDIVPAPSMPAETVGPVRPKIIMPKFEKLLAINDEVSGWIKIDGTRVDYPFVRHDDNDYYLHMSIENKKSKRGCIYIDYRNSPDLSDKNTLVYGHNMKDGSMFKDLVQYKNEEFFRSHSVIHMDSLYERMDWQVFSVYVVDADKETIDIDYSQEGSFLRQVNGFKSRSMYETNVELEDDDSIITLVTCSYETKNSRTIVHAKRLKTPGTSVP